MQDIKTQFICDLDDFKNNASTELGYVPTDKILAVLDKNKLFFYALHIEYFNNTSPVDITPSNFEIPTDIITPVKFATPEVNNRTVYDENSMVKMNLPDFKKKIKDIDEPTVVLNNGSSYFYIFPHEYVNFLF